MLILGHDTGPVANAPARDDTVANERVAFRERLRGIARRKKCQAHPRGFANGPIIRRVPSAKNSCHSARCSATCSGACISLMGSLQADRRRFEGGREHDERDDMDRRRFEMVQHFFEVPHILHDGLSDE
jgi:hypothetical protein